MDQRKKANQPDDAVAARSLASGAEENADLPHERNKPGTKQEGKPGARQAADAFRITDGGTTGEGAPYRP
jgi:hypothetical protein